MKLLLNCITLLVWLCSIGVTAQPKPLPDSIRVELPDQQSIITFELRQYTVNKSVIKDFPSQLNDLLDHVENSLPEAGRDLPKRISFVYATDGDDDERHTLTITDVTIPETKAIISQHVMVELLPPGWEINIKMKEAEIHVYAPGLAQLKELTKINLEPVLQKLDAHPEMQRQKRFGDISRIVVSNGTVVIDKVTHRLPYDMLGLHAGAGIGLLQNKFYPEFNVMTAFYLANRYRKNFQRISAHYELKLFTGKSPEGEYLSWPSSFVSVSYALNFRNDRPRWTGIGAGLLVNNRSDMFTGKTLKLFIESDIGSSKLNIIPELFLTNDFKQTLFGLKLNYKF
ncbi:MAG: hypothetical protein MUE95_08670 [Cyclobacteriaceae bacterium]|jgi:hypothetical protein|nr:hypothetical protein [Cyclobacteriaceae bacterium]